MKKIALFLLLVVSSLKIINAQSLAINSDGSSADASAVLDIKSTNKGLLIPRVTTAQRAAISSPSTGLIVFQTDGTAGFYYNAGTPSSPNWLMLINGSNSGWGLTGNAGTAPATNFIGTTDAQPLRFRVNNTWAGQIHTTNVNTSFGLNSFNNSATGWFNTAFGEATLRSNSSGAGNNAFGANALNSNIGGNSNGAFGDAALLNNTYGGSNTTSGSYSMFSNTFGSFNTAMGYEALRVNVSGNYNTAIGYRANVSANNLNNAIAIGANTIVDASNKVRIGNTDITVIEGQVAFTNPSDARFKNNIKANVPGLEFITKLQPVTYLFDTKKLETFTKTGKLENTQFTFASNNPASLKLHTGFLAQDVEKIAKQLGYDFDGVNAPTDNKGYYTLGYSQFVVPLVQAVKEQQIQIEEQKNENDTLKKQLQLLLKRIEKLENQK